MSHVPSGRRARRTAGLAVVTAASLSATLLAGPPAAAAPRGPANTVDAVSLFPTNDLTVADPAQLTGRRVALPTEGCTVVVQCGLVERLNQLDGFDLDPRLAVRFSGPVDPEAVAEGITVEQVGGGSGKQVTGVDRVVWDAATSTLYAHPAEQLREGTTYRLRVGTRDVRPAQSTFTTLSATDGLRDLRAQIDGGLGDLDGLEVDTVVPAQGTTLTYVPDRPQPADRTEIPVPSVIGAGSLVFGSFTAPSWLRADRTIEQTPTAGPGPAPTGSARLPFVLVLPAGQAPEGGWPLSVFGHGFTRSDADVFLAAATNARQGVATIATTVVGHGYGPASTWRIRTSDGAVQEVPAYGRGVDLDGNGRIGDTEGSSTVPSGPDAAIGSRDALRQTAADNMVLLRAAGSDADDDRLALRPSGVTYFGQSFGGIYGSLLTGADPAVARAGLNVPGGPITEIARLSPAFRLLTTQALSFAGPPPGGLLNGGNAGFTESMPLAGAPAVLEPAAGALPIQEFLARSTWLARPGSPEAFSPLIAPERVLFQVAFGDRTVPNPTSHTLVDAGDLFARTSLFRNDKTDEPVANPHGFLLNPLVPAPFGQGQLQITTFLQTGTTIDPDGPGAVWEVPIADPSVLLSLNF